MRLLLLLLLALPVHASTLIVQSHDITVAYGESLARSYDTRRLIKVRDFSTDVNDNRELTLERIVAKTNKYDNLIVLGYNGTFRHSNVTVVPVFADIAVYSAKFLPIIKHFEPTSKVHVVCNTICPAFGDTVHQVTSTLQLRSTLIALNKTKESIIVVNSLLSLYDNDSQDYMYGSEIAKEFARIVTNHLDVSILHDDKFAAITLWVPPARVFDGTYTPDIYLKLDRVRAMRKLHVLYTASQSVKLKVY